jgi:Zn-dependent protease with chaperone function
MGKLEIIVVLAFIALILSSNIREPAPVTELRSMTWRLNCSEPACIISKVQIGTWADYGLVEKTKQEVLNGTVNEALSFLLAHNDAEVRQSFRSRIDEKISQVKLGGTPSDELILLAKELKFRAEHNSSDEESQRKFNEIKEWLAENGKKDFLYVYALDIIGIESRNMSRANLSDATLLLLSITNAPVNSELIGPNSEQVFLSRSVANEIGSDIPQERLAEDLCSLFAYYSITYPAVIIKDSIFSMMAVYALPLALICWMSVLSYFTSKGRGKSIAFQREYSKNLILTALLAIILFPILIQLSLLFSLFPAAIYIIFVLPILLPTFFYIWSSTNLLKDYGLVKISRERFLIARYKESILIAAGGALITVVSLLVISNMQRIFAYMSFGVVSALAVLFLLVFFSIFAVVLFPMFIEFTSQSCEIGNLKMRKRLKALAEKLGYNVGSIRVIPTAGSNLANAFQSGLIGNNVKIFIFETMLDRRKFNEKELEAVVAHELAHINKRHVLKTVFGYLLIASGVIALFVVVSLLLETANLGTAREVLAISAPYTALAVAFISTMWMMRKFEFEADSAAAQMGYATELISALKKIDKHNLTPTTLSRFATIFSSHADLTSRIKNLRETQESLCDMLPPPKGCGLPAS